MNQLENTIAPYLLGLGITSPAEWLREKIEEIKEEIEKELESTILMAIAFRQVGTVIKGTTANITPTQPAGHVANDILICKLVAADNATGGMPAGWVQKLGLNNGANARYEEWWKRDNGAEGNPLITRTGTKIASMAWIEAYSGVDTGLSDPYRDAQTGTGTGTATGGYTITCPALTGVVAGDYRMAGMMQGILNDTSGASTFSTIAGWAERVDTSQTAGASGLGGASDNLLAAGSAGAVTSTCNWDGGTAPKWIAAQSALSSATSGPGFVRPTVKVILQAVQRVAMR